MLRIHRIVRETAGPTASRPATFTPAELREFAAACDALHPPGAREPDWSEVKRRLNATRYPERIDGEQRSRPAAEPRGR